MAKFFGPVGYAIPTQVEPGIWKDQIIEHNYSGEVIKNSSAWSSTSDSTNDNLKLNNQISFVADPFAYQNFQYIKYVQFMGTKWKVTNTDASQYPRLVLTVGGVYNG